ncbi:MAG: serine/threonine-protein kinase [Planctomycetota bacterium]
MSDSPRADADVLNALVQECADRWQAEGSAVVERLCAQHPEHATRLRRRLDLLEKTGLLQDRSAEVPRHLGEFVLRGQIGSGGMGVVYRALQPSLQREVALKVIRPDHSFFDDSRQRFLREVNAVARLQHPGIVPVHVVGEDRGVLFYAMDLVPGCTLAQVLAHLGQRDPASLTGRDLALAVAQLTPAHREDPDATKQGTGFAASWVETCLRLVLQVAEALEHAHGRGVLHRDVKPSNVMLTPGGRILLLDFGLASTTTDPRITRSGAELGSLAYMAPEQVRGDAAAIAATTDVYGAGVLLYELLTLAQPFARATAEATRQAVLAGRPAALRARNRALASDAALVCQTAIDPDPARRYASAEALARDLGNVLGLRPIAARPLGAALRLRRAVQRHPARALSVVFAAVLLLGVFPTLYLQQRAASRQLSREKKRTEDALFEAQKALEQARAEQKRARWSLGKAREAVDHFLADIGQFRAVDIPLLEELRRDTLRQAATLYEQLQQDRDGAADPELRVDEARTLLSLAQVLRELDRHREAEPVLRRTIDALNGLPHAAADGEAARLLAAAKSALGAALVSLDRPDEAEAPLAEAAVSLRALAAQPTAAAEESDAGASIKPMLLRNALNLAGLRRNQNRPDEAAALYDEAIAVGAQMEPRIEVLRIRADAHLGLAQLRINNSEVDPAREQYEAALALRREIAARAPSSARFRRELATTLERLGLVLQAWRPASGEQALAYLDEAAGLLADLVRDFPRQCAYRVGYCRARLLSARQRQALDRDQDAERDFRDAIANLEHVRAELPLENTWRAPLGFALYSLAEHLHQHGRSDEARATLDQADRLADTLLAESPDDTDVKQQHAELILARSTWKLTDADGVVASARRAFELGLGFLRDHPDDPQLRGTAFRAFDHLVALHLDAGDVEAALATADTYGAANPYKWLSQLTLARTYLRCEGLLPAADLRRTRCREQARRAVLRAGEHMPKAVVRIEKDDVFAPLLSDPEVKELLERGHAASGS